MSNDTFIVYCLIECSGEYEDYHERNVFSSTDMEKIENEKARLEQENTNYAMRARRCEQCDIFFGVRKKAFDNETEQSIREYCKSFVPLIEEEDRWVDCENYTSYYDDDVSYRIDELVVHR